AGSGKTELLIQRYLRLLATVENPEEILAITFTRKAAAEMQLRVLEALRREAAGVEPDEAHLKVTAGLARRALERSDKRGWGLLGSPRRMRILTLDALNATIARAQPLTAEQGLSGGRIVVDADLKSVHREAAVATLDWLTETGPMADAARDVLAHVDNNTGLYIAYVAAMLTTRDQWLPFIGSGSLDDQESAALRAQFEQSLRLAVTSHLERTRAALAPYEQVADVFGYAADNLLADGKTDNPVVVLADVDALPGSDPDDVATWQGIAELLLVKSAAQFRKQVNKNNGFPTTGKDEKALVTGMLKALANDERSATLLDAVRTLPPVTYSDHQWQVLLALFRLLPLAVSELKRLFTEKGLADHIEVALAAGTALGSADSPGDVALLLDYQVRHILVDEMQDTSSAQYRMLEALTGGWEAGDDRTLFCVGDPMQSIYRFRNAEVGQFLLAREHGIGDIQLESLVLRRNFRSGEILVDWFNEVFPNVLAAENDPARGEVAYEAAVSAAHLTGQGTVAVHPVFGTAKAAEATTGCEVIKKIVAMSPDDDIAVLVQGRSQLPELLARLRDAGIGYSAVEIDRLT
ncbi:MAG: UvrD-helicase domain-containing protein, partial [Pseudomonadota bacterium]